MLYVNAENRGYRKLHGRDTLLWDDAGVNSNPVLKIEINNAGAEILGYKCDEAILTTKLGVEKYYFSTKLGVDVSAYAKHSLANWYDLIKATRSLPLKAIVETSLFTVTSVATEVTEMKLDDSEFQLPKNVKSEKSPS
jgi:hypothetical protein